MSSKEKPYGYDSYGYAHWPFGDMKASEIYNVLQNYILGVTDAPSD